MSNVLAKDSLNSLQLSQFFVSPWYSNSLRTVLHRSLPPNKGVVPDFFQAGVV